MLTGRQIILFDLWEDKWFSLMPGVERVHVFMLTGDSLEDCGLVTIFDIYRGKSNS
jgi:hypothetical protein